MNVHLKSQPVSSSLVLAFVLVASQTAMSQDHEQKTMPAPMFQHQMTELHPIATFAVEGRPDWMAVTDDAVWVASSNVNHVVRLDAKTNQTGTVVTIAEPCSGLTFGFGSLWIPSCGDHNIVRVDAHTGKLQARIAASPADDEGGIAVGDGSVWVVTSKDGVLARIDPVTNTVRASIRIPAGSFNPAFANGSVWITSNAGESLIRVDSATNKVVSETPVGPKPRFLTVGEGSIWVLNQGDGTVARVDAATGKRTALIAAAIPGEGGEIAFGGGAVWATMIGHPITRIDPKTNEVVGQWQGKGGDSIRAGHESLWLSDLKGAQVWRLPLSLNNN